MSSLNFVPYIFAGPGIFHFNPYTTDRNGNQVYLQPLGTEGQGLTGYASKYSLTQLNVSLGLGVRYRLSDNLAIGAEFCFRKLFTDYLDDVSSNEGFIDPQIFINAYGAAKGTQIANLNFRSDELDPNNKVSYTLPRGNPASPDAYYTFQLRVSYRLENFFLGREFNGKRAFKSPKRVF